MIAYDDLLSVCVRYSGSDYYVDEVIPPKKLANARTSFPIPDYDRVVALVDTTALGSNKHGLAVCESGIRWSNDWTTDSEQTYLPWDQFATVTIKTKGSNILGAPISDP